MSGICNVQGKHRQTRKYYATYNALLEIKELMLKETSLLNSIISQVFVGELRGCCKFFSLAYALVILVGLFFPFP